MYDHGAQLQWKGQLLGDIPEPALSTFRVGGNWGIPGENPRLSTSKALINSILQGFTDSYLQTKNQYIHT